MSIKVEYWITHPTFLQRRFAFTRASLLGRRPGLSWRVASLKKAFSSFWHSNALRSRAADLRGWLNHLSQLRPTNRPNLLPQAGFFSRAKSEPAWLANLVSIVSWLLILSSLVVAVVVFAPAVYYRFVPADTKPVEAYQSGTPRGGSFEDGARSDLVPEIEVYRPPQDPTLPEGDWIIIPRIGVRTQIRPTEDPEEALSQGVWRAPDFGTPEENELPIILAAHRFGWDWWWQSDFWRYNSFYLLPETEPGDIVEIISDQRKWVYEIYAGEEGREISDYSGNLILYTCKFLNSPLRHFRYARLIDPTKSTQPLPAALETDFDQTNSIELDS